MRRSSFQDWRRGSRRVSTLLHVASQLLWVWASILGAAFPFRGASQSLGAEVVGPGCYGDVPPEPDTFPKGWKEDHKTIEQP